MCDECERDLVDFATEDGDTVTLEVINYFFYEGQEYAMLTDYDPECEGCEHEGCDCGDAECHCDDPECECGDENSLYIMKVVTTEEEEEFIPLSDEELDPIIEFLDSMEDLGDDEDPQE